MNTNETTSLRRAASSDRSNPAFATAPATSLLTRLLNEAAASNADWAAEEAARLAAPRTPDQMEDDACMAECEAIDRQQAAAPRQACIIIEAPKGHVRAAASLVRRALRAVGLTVHRGHYVSQDEVKSCGTTDSRFAIEMTDEQATAFQAEVHRTALAEGWTRAPIDFYHD